MAKIFPFRGLLYNKKNIKDFKTVLTPPYDVISPEMQDAFYRANPYNVVRIILGKESPRDTASDNKYTRAARFLDSWLKQGVLKRDEAPAIYIYEQEYVYKGKRRKRLGFVALMRIEEAGTGRVLPHEHTFAKPKEDRSNLMRATKANTEPIFCIFPDDSNDVIAMLKKYAKNRCPTISVRFEGVGNKVWNLTDTAMIGKIVKMLDKKQVFIADGHHRYEVAREFRNEMRGKSGAGSAGNFDNLMVYFSSLNDDNLTILSTYRAIRNLGGLDWDAVEKRLGPYFTVEEKKTKKAMFDALERVKSGYAFGIYFKNRRFYFVKLKDESVLAKVIREERSREWKRLNVTVLHFLVFGHIFHVDRFAANDENILYTRDEDCAIEKVNSGECEIAFFQMPTKMAEVRDIAKNGDKMPHKSTYFYPKPLSGLVMNRLV